MDWIAGIQRAIDYIEANITEEIDYDEVARRSFSSGYHFQRVFSIMCGYTLGEYIRNRRLALSGAELVAGGGKVIDVALKYGYESPDSFAKAFQKFHGIVPSLARESGATLRSFARLSVRISLEGGDCMNYRIEDKPAMVLTGYKRHFTGVPNDRLDQEEDFVVHTRANQFLLQGMAISRFNCYNVICCCGDDGYDFYIAALLSDKAREHIADDTALGEDAKRFENIELPARSYAVFETERTRYPTELHVPLRKRIFSEWLPSSGFTLAEAPEVTVTHWYGGEEQDNRYIEVWIPVERG